MKTGPLSIRGMIHAALFGAATAAGAYILIPLPPVPITLQTLFLYLAGALLGGRPAALSQAIYVLVGIMGFPVFAGGKAGLGVLFGPTGGYLWGFLLGAYAIGFLMERRPTPPFLYILFSMIAGTVLIYLPGVLQLSLVAGFSLQKAFWAGAAPFLIGDFLKILVAAMAAVKLGPRIRPRG